jgi:hypothetical protein
MHKFLVEKGIPKNLATYVIKKTTQIKQASNRQKFAKSGHPVWDPQHHTLAASLTHMFNVFLVEVMTS